MFQTITLTGAAESIFAAAIQLAIDYATDPEGGNDAELAADWKRFEADSRTAGATHGDVRKIDRHALPGKVTAKGIATWVEFFAELLRDDMPTEKQLAARARRANRPGDEEQERLAAEVALATDLGNALALWAKHA